jgi:hypothetical protein
MIWTYLAHPDPKYALGLCSFENCPWKSPNFQNLDPHLSHDIAILLNIINDQQLTIT